MDDPALTPPSPNSHKISPSPTGYMSVKDAIREQANVRREQRLNAPRQVAMPPNWNEVHQQAAYAQSLTGPRAGPPPKVGFPRAEDGIAQMSSTLSISCTSSVMPGSPGMGSAPGSPTRDATTSGGMRSALGGSSKSGLNHTSTYFYGEAPIKPSLCLGNQYNAVGSYSMFGSQAMSDGRPPERSARHLEQGADDERTSRPPSERATASSRRHPTSIHCSRRSAARCSTASARTRRGPGLEERFDADRRDQRAAQRLGRERTASEARAERGMRGAAGGVCGPRCGNGGLCKALLYYRAWCASSFPCLWPRAQEEDGGSLWRADGTCAHMLFLCARIVAWLSG